MEKVNDYVVPEYNEYVFKEKQHDYCLLIPLFNEGDRFFSQVEKMKKNNIFNLVDVVICDAGSSDGSTDTAYLNENNFRSILIRQGVGRYSTDLRMGYSWALKEGYLGFITVDGNDKDDTAAMPEFINKLKKGYDYVQGSRYIPGGVAINTPLSRHWALKLINEPVMSLCAKRKLTDTTNGFRAYSKKFMLDKRVNPFREVFYGYELIYYLPVSACKFGYDVIEIPVTRAYPDNGEVPSKVGGIKGNIYQLSILYHMLKNDYAVKESKER